MHLINLMASKYDFLKYHTYYHSNFGLINEFWKSYSLSDRWLIMSQAMHKSRQKIDFTLSAFVMMETHVHMLFLTQNKNAQEICHSFAAETDKILKIKTQNTSLDECHLVEIKSYQQFLNVYRYIYRNPVEVQLCKQAQYYPFSTLKEILGLQINYFNAVDPARVIQNPSAILSWINKNELDLFPKIF